MKYKIDGNTIKFKASSYKLPESLKLSRAAFDEAPGADTIEIYARDGSVLYANTMLVLTSVVSKTAKYYSVPLDIFKVR